MESPATHVARTLAHDFREPIRNIRWYLERIRKKFDLTSEQAIKLRELERLAAEISASFEHRYSLIDPQDLDLRELLRFVDTETVPMAWGLVQLWRDSRDAFSHIDFGSARLSIADLDRTIRRIPSRLQELLGKLDNPAITRTTSASEGTFARSAESSSTIGAQEISVKREIQRVLSELRPLMYERATQVSIEGSITDYFNQVDLASIIQNLLSNSVRYGRPKGLIEIYLGTCTPRGAHTLPRVRSSGITTPFGLHLLVFEDDGIGIDWEDLPFVFETGFRGTRARYSNDEGTGLGLPLVRAAAAAMGGIAWIDSLANVGTRAVVALPATSHLYKPPVSDEIINVATKPLRGRRQGDNGNWYR